MVILHVTVQIKPEHMAEYLEAVRHDAEHSEKDRARLPALRRIPGQG